MDILKGWRHGVVVECRTCNQEVAGWCLSRALWRKNSGQVSSHLCASVASSIIFGTGESWGANGHSWPCSVAGVWLRATEMEISAAL